MKTIYNTCINCNADFSLCQGGLKYRELNDIPSDLCPRCVRSNFMKRVWDELSLESHDERVKRSRDGIIANYAHKASLKRCFNIL